MKKAAEAQESKISKPYLKALALRLLMLLIIPYSLFSFALTPLSKYAFFGITRIFNSNSLMAGEYIAVGGWILIFTTACAAVSAYYLLFILVMLTKGIKFKTGLKLLLIGFLAIFMANMLRLGILLAVINNAGQFFDIIHVFMWRIIATIFVVLLWVVLAKKYKIKGIPVYSDIKYLVEKTKIFKSETIHK